MSPLQTKVNHNICMVEVIAPLLPMSKRDGLRGFFGLYGFLRSRTGVAIGPLADFQG